MRFLLFISLFFPFFALAQNTNLSNGLVFDGEPYIAVNPSNPKHLVVAWIGFKLGNKTVIKTRVSTDAGNTWSTTTNIPHVVSTYQSADPSLAFDNNGNVFLCYIDYSLSPIAGAVYVAKSSDGGLSWGTPVEVINAFADGTQYPLDRPWMAIDNSGGIYDGNIYVTTMNPKVLGPIAPPYNPYFIKSVNGGTSFEPWRYLDTANYLAGSFIPQPMPTPCVSADGTFHAVYPSYVVSQSLFAQMFVASSTSAGSTFTYNTVAQTATTNNDTLPKKGYLLISNPADANHLLFAYPNFDNGDIDVYIIESLNAGASWGTPVRVNDDPIANNRMQDLIWADFDYDGDLIVTWRDRRNAPDSTYKTPSEIWGAIRWKDSTSFSANFPITDSLISYNTVLENSGNDFMCVQLVNDTAYTVWGDTRNNFLNIWFQRLDLVSGSSSVLDLANDVMPFTLSPNPATNQVLIDLGANPLNEESSVSLMDGRGQLVKQIRPKQTITQLDVTGLAGGIYFVRFTSPAGSSIKKLIIN
ncbi:MAG: T9SS type A sorting domain-containing protein [Flavobacteriales bacterium]|nr:T9SS type A sorting domain-containing protein [Flavobacteriales bacterium]